MRSGRIVLGAMAASAAAVAALTVAHSGASEPHRSASAPPPIAAPVAPDGQGDTTHLRPALQRAVDLAIRDAAAQGVQLRVTSGWRSRQHQQVLYDQAIAKYGSRSVARQWVLPPEESAHVRGEAVDVGPASGARWLEVHGVHYGLCRRYDNEPWHFERLAAAKGSVCPPREPHA